MPSLTLHAATPTSQPPPTPSTPSEEASQALNGGRTWYNDGPPRSVDIVLQWLEIPGNWDHFKKGANGYTALGASREAATYMRQHGCIRRPLPTDKNINRLFSKYSEAYAWLHETGKGLDGQETAATRIWRVEKTGNEEWVQAEKDRVNIELYQRCPLYDTLNRIFNESQGGNPQLYGSSADETNRTVSHLQDILSGRHGDEEDNSSGGEQGDDDEGLPNGGASPQESQEPFAWSQTPAIESFETPNRPSTASTVSTTRTAAGNTTISHSSSSSRKRGRHAEEERAEHAFLENDANYQRDKLLRMEQANEIQEKIARAKVSKALAETAEVIKRNNEGMTWREALAEARDQMNSS